MQTSAGAYTKTEGWHSCRVNFLGLMASNASQFLTESGSWSMM